jgi:hypothetical protein
MATLSIDKSRNFASDIDPITEGFPMIASDIIFIGAAVGANSSGHMRPLESGDPFRGFAMKRADNSAGAAGDVNVSVRRQGIVQLTVTGVSAATDVGKPVYASDDDTFTLTQTASPIGSIAKWITSTSCLVYFQAAELRQITFDAGGSTTQIRPSGVISINTGSQATIGTSEETLMSFSLPANTLDVNGRGVRITAWGTTAANGNNKVTKITFGGTQVTVRGAAADNDHRWRHEVLVFRTGAATQESIGTVFSGTNNSGNTPVNTYATPGETLSGAVSIAVKATTASAIGDVTCEGLLVEVLP